MAHAGGRPPKYSKEKLKELAEKFAEYIESTSIPIIAEFAYTNDIDRTALYDNEEFSTLLKKCIAKKEAQLEKGVLAGKLNPAMGIFSLKQLGWSDKREIKITSDDETKKKLERTFDEKFSSKNTK